MPKLAVFNSISLDGFFTDSNGDLSWAHNAPDPEFDAFVEGNASGEGRLLFGRVTYEMMSSFWPTDQAMKTYPIVAAQMNSREKIVFSRTHDKATWNNTKMVKGDPVVEVRKLKNDPGTDMVILGSGSIVSQLAPAGVIDEYQFVVIPVVLGKGRTMFDGVNAKLPLKLTKSRTFGSGSVFLCYEPAG